MSRWRPGDQLLAPRGRRDVWITLGEVFSDDGRTSTIFTMDGRPNELAKVYRPGLARAELDLISDCLRGAFEATSVVGAFPLALLFAGDGDSKSSGNSREIAGFVMPRFVVRPDGDWWDFGDLRAVPFDERLPVARRLVEDVISFHAHDLIVGDFSYDNMLVNDHATISWLDTDSFGVREVDGAPLVSAPFGTPPWLAPEIARGEADCSQDSDAYVVGLLVLTLLNQGMHPPHRFERIGELDRDLIGRIADEDSWMREPRQFKARLADHPGISAFPDVLRELADDLLTRHAAGDRPGLARWAEALAEVSAEDLLAARQALDRGAREGSQRDNATTVAEPQPLAAARPSGTAGSRPAPQPTKPDVEDLIVTVIAVVFIWVVVGAVGLGWTWLWSSGFDDWSNPMIYIGWAIGLFLGVAGAWGVIEADTPET